MYFIIKNKIFIHKLFLIVPIIPFLGISVKFYFFTLLFAFIHEAAHFSAALVKGETVHRLFITPCGLELCISLPKKENEYFILFSGPAISLLIAIFFSTIGLQDIASINFILFAINIIPAIPLDGGRILKVFLWDKYGAVNGTIILRQVSFFLSFMLFVISIVILNIWLFCISGLIFIRSRRLSASAFCKKRAPYVPLKFYYFEKNANISVLLRLISPYNYLAIITPFRNKVIFEWEILEKIEHYGFTVTLKDV